MNDNAIPADPWPEAVIIYSTVLVNSRLSVHVAHEGTMPISILMYLYS